MFLIMTTYKGFKNYNHILKYTLLKRYRIITTGLAGGYDLCLESIKFLISYIN